MDLSIERIFKKNFFSFFYLFFLGLISAYSLPPYNYFIINFFTFSLFFVFLTKKKNNFEDGSFFKYGWFFGFGYFLSSLYWITISLTFDQSLKFLIPLALVLIPGFLAIFYGIVAFLFSLFYSKNIISSFLTFSLLFGTIELVRGHIFSGFPWNLIAFSFSENLNFIQILSIIGTYSFNLVCISLFTSPALLILRNSKKEVFMFLFFILIYISFYIFGGVQKNRFEAIKSTENDYTIRSISSNITLDRFFAGSNEIDILNELISLSKPNDKKPTIFLWPEGIIPTSYIQDIQIYKSLFLEHFNKNDIIIMGINRSKKIKGKKLFYNSIAAFDHQLNLIDFYDKIRLVPFGEYLPFNKFLQSIGLKTIANEKQSYSVGSTRKPLQIKQNNFSLNLLPLICYEIIYSGKLFKDQDFDYIINVSEDGWFGKSVGPKQHFSHGIFRSIESGKYIIRSANNGISSIINPTGSVEKKVDFGSTGFIDFTKSKSIKPTIFSIYGNKIFTIMILLYIFLIFSFNKIKNE